MGINRGKIMGHLQDIFIDVANMVKGIKLTNNVIIEIESYIYNEYKYNITRQEIEFVTEMVKE
jgi:hypothetical protein